MQGKNGFDAMNLRNDGHRRAQVKTRCHSLETRVNRLLTRCQKMETHEVEEWKQKR